MTSPDASLLSRMDAYWRAANYLSVGQIYLLDNPLLRVPLEAKHVKPRLLGHWGTSPGLNLIYVHMNRIIREHDLNAIYITGPGHGGPALVANVYLEGTYTEVYPHVTRDEAGLKTLFRQFSFPGGIPSHVAPETPGSIHEGGELGYSLSHAAGAVLDNPDLFVACVIGDGEAETGPLATAWHSNKFLDPVHDGAVLPILHLNGYKIANPTIFARIPHAELEQFMRGCGWDPLFVVGNEPEDVHRQMAAALDTCLGRIREIQDEARTRGASGRPRWPMIVLQTPKGWTGPKSADGKPVEGTFRAHQVPLSDPHKNPEHLRQLESWLRSYRPDELFDAGGRLVPDLQALAPEGERRMGANPNANGGLRLRELRLPDFRSYAVDVPAPGKEDAEATRVLGTFLRDVMKLNDAERNFRLFGPDETLSNRLNAVFETTNRQWEAETQPHDEFLAPEGRVIEVLSEHQCQGFLEGYLLTGRHGLFNSYEAFIHIVDSMFNQHAKWLNVTRELPWRAPIASLNYLLSSHVWQQDHNGFTHQDPGFIDVACNKKAEVVRVYLPPDANMPALGDGPLSPQPPLRQHRRRRQAAGSAVALDGRRGPALHRGNRGVGLGQQRRRRRARPRDGGRRRRAHPRDARGRDDPPAPAAEAQDPHRQRRRPHEASAPERASARPARRRVRRALHEEQADHLRVPRLSLADPPPRLPADESQEPARPRVQGGRHDHDALRHDRAQRHRPVPSRAGRHSAASPPRGPGAEAHPGARREALRAPSLHPRARAGHARDPGLALGLG